MWREYLAEMPFFLFSSLSHRPFYYPLPPFLCLQDDHHRSFRRQYGRGDDSYVHLNIQPAQPNKTSSAAPSRVAPDPEKGESTGAISSTQASSSGSTSSSS